jgi:outer membrane protein
MTRLKELLSFSFLLLTSITYGQQKHELTVKEAVEMAYKNVIELKNAQLDYHIQEAQNKEIFGRALPQISAVAGAQYYLQLPKFLFPDATSTAVYSILKEEGVSGSNGPITDVPPPTLREVSFQQPWNTAVGATLQQLLFQPDVFVGLQARKTALNLSAAFIEQTKEHVKDSAYRRYYAILVAQKQLHFIDESIKRLEKLYRDDSIMFKNGFAERLDLDRVQVQLNNLRSTRTYVDNGVTISYAALKFALGLPQQDTVLLKEELTAATIKEGILDSEFKYEDRAEIRTLQASKELQQLDVKRNQMGSLPTVALSGNYSLSGQGQRFIFSGSTVYLNSSYIGLNISVPIFDGFQRRNKTQQALLRVNKIDNNITNVKQAIDFQQTVSRESLKSALANLDTQERNLELALKVYNTTKLKFEQGLGSSFEVLQADADYQQAQNNYFNALYNATVAKIGYQSSLGKLQ